MFGNPKDDPWANKRGGDDDDDWDTDPDFENKDTIKAGKKEEIVSAAEAQRQLRGQLDEERSKKFGLPTTVNVDRGNWKDPGASAPSGGPARWNPQQEIGGRGAVSAAKNTFSQPAQPDPAPRAAPARAPAPKPAPVQSAPPPKPAPVQSAPPPRVQAPPPAQKAAAPPPPAPKAAPPPPAPVAPPPAEESWDDQGGYDQGGYDQGGYDQGGYDQGGYDQGGYDQGGYDQGGYDQGGYDQGGYDQSGYDQGSYDQGGYDQGAAAAQCRALYEYGGENETDLRFYEGDIITILNDSDPSGWWEGELNGVSGYFPSNFVERV